MTTAMTKSGDTTVAAVTAGSLTRDQVELLKRTICKGASDDELGLFLQVCKAKQLDPFSGQIHAVKRSERNPDGDGFIEKMTYQTGIDGFRVMAERTGERDGEDEAEWCGADGMWRALWTDSKPPVAARVKVYRKGCSRPFVGLAYWSFYVQTKKDGTPNRMWSRGGPHMLAKCAEALAYRKAFPDQLADVYSPEEMEQAENERPPAGVFQPAPTTAAPPPAEVVDGAKALLERVLAVTTIAELELLLPNLGKAPEAAKRELREAYAAKKRQLFPPQTLAEQPAPAAEAAP